jgi:hypothetical protein
MKEQFHIVLITVGLFVTGLLMGIWTQKTRPVPPPPAPVLGEFGGAQAPQTTNAWIGPQPGALAIQRFSPGHAAAIVTINRNLAELEPKIAAFQSSVEAIEKDFREKLNKLLTAEQQKKLAAIEAEQTAGFAAGKAQITGGPGGALLPPLRSEIGVPPPPPGAEGPVVIGFGPPFPPGGWLMMSMIVYQPSLEHLNSELKLDAKQQAAAQNLMIERRARLLALMDKSPPPTLGFGSLP